MNRPTDPCRAAQTDTPIANFSQCHVGIIGHLDALAELPSLMAPARRARALASDMQKFFDEVILRHHSEEELDLFPAVLQSARPGDEGMRVASLIERLTIEHRQIEAWWALIRPQLKQIAKGHDTELDDVALQQLVKEYHAHAEFEEKEFLPLSQTILSRNGDHMAALGLSLHLRHARPMEGYV